MIDKSKEIKIFVRQVLGCIKEQRLSVEKVHKNYLGLYPPSFFKKKFTSPVSEVAINSALHELVSHGFLMSELTRWYEGESLSEDIRIYSITDKGRSFLISRGKKN